MIGCRSTSSCMYLWVMTHLIIMHYVLIFLYHHSVIYTYVHACSTVKWGHEKDVSTDFILLFHTCWRCKLMDGFISKARVGFSGESFFFSLPLCEMCTLHFFLIWFSAKPLPPEDFSCISENWENLNCTWTEPYNPVRTTYALSYLISNRFGT